jgi:hypothetical protein
MAVPDGLPMIEGAACYPEGCACASRAVAEPRAVRVAKRRLRQCAWWLTTATIGWNSLDAVIAVGSGLVAG